MDTTSDTQQTDPILPDHRVVLVTGASSGIGEAVASRLAAAGHHVLAGARRTERLDALVARIRPAAEQAGGSIAAVALDVTDRASMTAAVAQAIGAHGRLDVLVSNAGVMPLSRLDALLVDEWDRMLDVNVRGLLHGIAATLPVFERQGRGHVVSVASIGAYQVSPTAAAYCASKYAAWAIAEGLRLESDPSLRVTTISPGVVESELASTISDPTAAAGMVEYRKHAIEPDAIARAVAYAIEQPSHVDVNEIVVRPTRQR